NSQCLLDGSLSQVTVNGNSLTLTVTLTFKPSFPGLRNAYGLATDANGVNSNWRALGTWTGSANLPPSAVSVAPNSGTGANQAFTFLYSDPNGYTDISVTYALFNSTLFGGNACWVAYVRASN